MEDDGSDRDGGTVKDFLTVAWAFVRSCDHICLFCAVGKNEENGRVFFRGLVMNTDRLPLSKLPLYDGFSLIFA